MRQDVSRKQRTKEMDSVIVVVHWNWIARNPFVCIELKQEPNACKLCTNVAHSPRRAEPRRRWHQHQTQASSRKQKQRRRRRKYRIAFSSEIIRFMFRDFGRARCRFCVPFIFHSLCECWMVRLVCNGWNETAVVWGSEARTAWIENTIIVYLFMLLLVRRKATTRTRIGSRLIHMKEECCTKLLCKIDVERMPLTLVMKRQF